jgi:dihydrofolate synthase / folylpolyglutamate synthase
VATPIDRLSALASFEHSGGFLQGQYSQDAIRAILDRLGDPHRDFKSIHVAGTNGKGSVCHMLHAMFIAAGYRTGLYTSPHLERINERIVINGDQIADEALDLRIVEILDAMEGLKAAPTYFDALTAVGFRHFSREKVDIAIVETGLGGRLDSTNVVTPCVSIITDIARDHTAVLGNSLRRIAKEKAGIIKPGVPVVSSNSRASVVGVLEERSRSQGAPLHLLGRDFNVRLTGESAPAHIRLDYSSATHALRDVPVGASGNFQARNAALAIHSAFLAASCDLPVPGEAMRKGLGGLSLPGRLAPLNESPRIVFDPAHNPAAMREVLKSLRNDDRNSRLIVVFSVMRDKDHVRMARMISSKADLVYYFETDDPRGLKIAEIAPVPVSASGTPWNFVRTVDELSLSLRERVRREDVLLFTGSFRLFRMAREISLKLSKYWS